MSTFSAEDIRLISALDALAAAARDTDAARERMVVALGVSRLALAAQADTSVLCLDQDCEAEAYSFEEAREAAASRRPRRDLLAAGLEKPARAPSKKKSAKRADETK